MQIRTYAMHRTAEYGIAAHWRYKETKNATIVGPPAHIDEMTWLRQLLDWQREASRPERVPRRAALRPVQPGGLRLHAQGRRDRRCRPARRRSTSPTRCTPRSGTSASAPGSTASWCRWSRTLSNGDVIEIFTSKSETAGPTQDWLGFVKSPRARTKIRQYFNKERREEAIEAGKDAIVKAMRKQGLPLQRMLTSDALMTIARDLHLADVAALYAAVGESQVSAQSVVQRLVAGLRRRGGRGRGHRRDRGRRPARRAPAPPRTTRAWWSAGVSDVWIKLARCCTPVPGDAVFGFVTRSGGVSVHRDDCANAEDLRRAARARRRGRAGSRPARRRSWSRSRSRRSTGTSCWPTSPGCSPRSGSTSSPRRSPRPATGWRSAGSRFEMADPKHLGHLLAAVRKVDGVFDAYRVTSGA